MIFIRNNNIYTFFHDIKERFEYLVESFLSLFRWKHQSIRNHPLWTTDPHETANLPIFSIFMILLNEIKSEVKSKPMTVFLEVFLHSWSDYNQ